MTDDLDPHGQPFNVRFNRARRAERDLSEFLGLARGLLADGRVSSDEADLLHSWVETHPDAVEQWPVNRLAERIGKIFADGRADDSEREDLAELLASILGGSAQVLLGSDSVTDLPLDRPPPGLVWPGSTFVLTGKFAFGPRVDCEREIAKRGGQPESIVTQRTRYLVIGTFGSRDWVHTAFGRKILKAVKYRDAGLPLAIIEEEHWALELG